MVLFFFLRPTGDGGVVANGGAGLLLEQEKSLHLEVTTDEELASHGCDGYIRKSFGIGGILERRMNWGGKFSKSSQERI